LKGHKSCITKVAIHPIYSDVASSSEDGSVKLWDYDQGELSHTLKGHTGKVNYVTFHPNGQVLATCSTDQTIKLWNYQSRMVVKTLQGHEHEVSSLDFLPGGDFWCLAQETRQLSFGTLTLVIAYRLCGDIMIGYER